MNTFLLNHCYLVLIHCYPLFPRKEKNGIICSAPLFFAVGQYFISPWNFKPFISILYIKCNPKQNHATQSKTTQPQSYSKLLWDSIKQSPSHVVQLSMLPRYPSRAHWGFLQNAAIRAAVTEQEAKATFIAIHPDRLSA